MLFLLSIDTVVSSLFFFKGVIQPHVDLLAVAAGNAAQAQKPGACDDGEPRERRDVRIPAAFDDRRVRHVQPHFRQTFLFAERR